MIRVRTGYSFRSAAGKIEDVMQRQIECEYPVAPITDRASTFGWVKWSKLAEKHNLRPVFGVELAVTDSLHAKKPAVDYWTFLAKDNIESINKLVELATQQFRYEPLLTYAQANAVQNVFRFVGHRSLLDHVNPDPDTFLALAPSVAKGYVRAALAKGLLPVAASDNKYPRTTDKGLYEVVCGRGASTQSYDQHLQTRLEWLESVAGLELGDSVLVEAWDRSAAILGGSTAVLPKASLLVPEKPETLFQMCVAGAVRLKCDLSNPVYGDRLAHELRMIAEKQFEDYFYIVADICQFARKRMLVGPARGSSCGSLVCYLLGITTIDPIPYGLIFERFIDVTRNDLPDIDIDFSDQQRHLVFDYLYSKYGSDRVARLGTVAVYKPRSAMHEAGAALKVPKWKTEAVANVLIERSVGDARALQTLQDTINNTEPGRQLFENHPEMMVAAEMEGHPRHASQHAAGIIICSEAITKYVAVDHRTGATMCDKYDAESLNFLKIDALGLTQLSIIEDTLDMAGIRRDTFHSIPLDDPAAFQILNDKKFSGIFQFNGVALQQLTKRFRVDCFNDIASVTALARPGPLASGGANEWAERRLGTSPVSYPHPIFEPFLSDTLGIPIYQEQVMEIARKIGGLSWEDVTALRRAMSRSLGKEFFDRYGDPWKKGAIEKGVDPQIAEKMWDNLCSYGSWAFNKSHSVAYAMISYQCCWLKAHCPVEFGAATLTHETDPERQIILLRELVEEGAQYIAVDKDLSTDRWTVGYKDGKKTLVGPLSNIKGIGPKMVNSILECRSLNLKLPGRAEKLFENAKTHLDSLYPIQDAFQRILPDPWQRNIQTVPVRIKQISGAHDKKSIVVFCVFEWISPFDENEPVFVARRGFAFKSGPTQSLKLRLADDTDTIYGYVNRFAFKEVGQPVVDRGEPGQHLYAVKGIVKIGPTYRMMTIENIRYIGPMNA